MRIAHIWMVAFAIILISNLSAKAHDLELCGKKGVVYCQIIANSPNLNSKFAKKLQREILRASNTHKVPKRVLTAILMQESSYRMGITSRGGDIGMSQISPHTLKAYGLNKKRLLKDLRYSINAGAKVLGWFYRKYSLSEPDSWYARYNCGTRKISHQICRRYLKGVDRWL